MSNLEEISEDRMDVEWDDDFQPTERQHFVWDVITAKLKERPGKWAKIPGANTSLVTMIRHGQIRAFQKGRWQSASRHGDLFVRFLGPDLGHSDQGSIEGH